MDQEKITSFSIFDTTRAFAKWGKVYVGPIKTPTNKSPIVTHPLYIELSLPYLNTIWSGLFMT